MAEIQNRQRPGGGGQTWEEAYRGKTGQDIKDLNEELLDYLRDRNDLDEAAISNLREYLDSLTDVSDHWSDINDKIEEELENLSEYRGSLADIRDTFASIKSILSGNRREFNEGFNIVKKIEALARDSVQVITQEGGLTSTILDRQIRQSQTLKEQYSLRVKMLAPDLDLTNLSADNLASLDEKRKNEERSLATLQRSLEVEQKKRGINRDAAKIRQLRDEIRLHELNIELLGQENLKAVFGLEKQLKLRKELWKEQRRGGEAAGPNAVPARRVTVTTKILSKLGLSDEAKELTDDYNEWVSRRVGAIENRKNFANEAIESLRSRGISIQSEKDLEKYRDVKGSSYASLTDSDKAAIDAYNKAIEKQGFVFSENFGLASKLVKSIASSLVAVAALIGVAIFRALLKFDEQAVQTKRVIGQWADATAIANQSLVTGTEVLKTMVQLGQQFRINPVQVFTSDELGKVAETQKLTGMTAEAAGNLAVQSKIIGVNTKNYRDSITRGANAANGLNHSAISLSAVQNEVLSTSRAITLSYGNNTEALAKAAGTAAAIGMNLQQVENIAKNLMNFESSIQSEMQAQLLTGMQLNLATARRYALNNDLEGVAREIGSQGVDAARFSHMNYIQQENLAKALGMSREEMSKMLIMQEISRGLTAEQVAAMTGMRTEDVEALSAQQKWQTMKQKFLEALVPLLEPILQVVSDIAKPVTWVLGGISKIVAWISTLGGKLGENNVRARSLIGSILTGLLLFTRPFVHIIRSVQNVAKGIAGWVSNLKAAKVASDATNASMSKGGLAGAAGGAGGRFVKAPVATQAANAGKTTTGLGKSVGGLGANMGNLVKGAAAAVLIAGALWVLGKACQEFMKVSWESVGKAVVGMLALVGMVTLLGVAMTTGYVAVAIVAGAAAMAIMAGAAWLLGTALQQFEKINWETIGKLPVAMLSLAAAGALALIAGPTLFAGSLVLLAASGMLTLAGLALAAASLPFSLGMNGIVRPLERFSNLPVDRLTSVISVVKSIAEAISMLSGSIKDLNTLKLAGLVTSLGALSAIRTVGGVVGRLFGGETETIGETAGNSGGQIEESANNVTVQQVRSQQGTQVINNTTSGSVDLSKIYEKMTRIETAIVESRPDWNWVTFGVEMKKNTPWMR